jgi:SAM-dependent methyltransferase
MILGRVARKIRQEGLNGVINTLVHRVLPQQFADFQRFRSHFEGKIGLEIGGPSGVFGRKGILPIYSIVERLDNCTFSQSTLWEKEISEGYTFVYDKNAAPGRQYILDGSSLAPLDSSSYDFVLSSHVIEHMANPLLGLSEWLRVLKPAGQFVIVVPHKDGTFDHLRPVTSFDHLLSDLERHVDESDMTHLEEILELHDLSRDPEAGGFDAFRLRALNNLNNRGLHHHVFDTRLAIKMLEYVGLRILDVQLFRPFHIVVIAQKYDKRLSERALLAGAPDIVRWKSPFPSDARPSEAE